MPQAVAAIAAFAAASAVNAFIVQIGISLALSFVSRALFRPSTPRPAELIRELAIPNSRPPYRFVYGRYRTYGSPAPWRVKGNTLYGAIILNSRPSVGGVVNIYIDKRTPTSVTGNIYDFTGDGLRFQLPSPAEAFSDANRPRVWLSLGDKTSPPTRFTTNAPEYFQTTDGWQGRTVLWVELQAGDTEQRGDRWPRVPPEIEVEMDWSRVWDPRDPAQDPDDESTWGFTDNQALVLLDALRRNPIRAFGTSNLLLQSFEDAADVADQDVALKAGGTEKRYTANGVIIWDGREIEEQVQPIVDSGAGTTVRVGGRLGYLAGAWRAPIYTATDILADGGIDFKRLLPGRDLPRGIVASYINPDRDWKEADLPAYPVPNAPPLLGNDGTSNIKLPFCTSPTQAMRVQKIAAKKAGAQKRLSCVLPPEAFDVLAGSNITLNLPDLQTVNGTWEIVSINAGISLTEPDGGVAMRVPVELTEIDETIYDWDPATDEIDIATESFVPTRPPVSPPSDLQTLSGPSQAVAGQPRIRFSFLPSPSGTVTQYEWQWRPTGTTYEQGGYIDASLRDDDDRVFGYLSLVEAGAGYDIRVRATAPNRVSTWIEVINVIAVGETAYAYGGVVTEPLIGGTRYRVHTFTSGDTLEVTAPGDMEYMIIAGGGGGGGSRGSSSTGAGGGGAGGMLEGSGLFVTGNYTVTVGAGGAGGLAGDPPQKGTSGADSFVGALQAFGGGGGASGATNGGLDGGSGGGNSDSTTSTGVAGQGNAGGRRPVFGNGPGGGGGAGAAGQDGYGTTPDYSAGDGGAGRYSDINGTNTAYAGGGGGGGYGAAADTGTGGIGGGADGGAVSGDGTGQSAAANTGGGGGGAARISTTGFNGGDGGSGIVIIRYPTS